MFSLPVILVCCYHLFDLLVCSYVQVLLTSYDAVLANLTPALVAEENMLRERFTHRYNRTLFGMFPRSRRGESSKIGEGDGSSMDRSGGIITRRSSGSKPVETDGAPLVDQEDLFDCFV